MTPPKRPPTHVGDRGEHRSQTPGRGVPAELLPPPRTRRPSSFDFDSHTPIGMDPETFHALQKLREEMLAADTDHGKRIGAVETGLGTVATSHAQMAGEFQGLKETIIQDRNDEREDRRARAAAALLEQQKRADHRRALAQKIVGGVFSVGVLTALVALIAKGC